MFDNTAGWPRRGRRGASSSLGRAVRFVVGLAAVAALLGFFLPRWEEISSKIDELRSEMDDGSGAGEPAP
jgi:hypothetical protein